MKSKIRWRLLLYFSGSFLIFSLIIGLVFSTLFFRHNMEIHKTELENRSARIATSLGELMVKDPGRGQGQGQGHGMMGHMGYGAYLRFIDDIAMTDVWIVDRNLALITRGHGQTDLAYDDLPPGAEATIATALAGQSAFSESFGALLGAPSITVATPITVTGGQVVGVVLMHERTGNIRGATLNGLFMLLLGIGVAILISFFVAGTLAARFTKPLDKMKAAALKISGGDYTVRTSVSQDDEIGALAEALDEMAAKLDAASRESARLDQLRRDFVANISHELRTPVTVIRGSLEALCDKVVTKPDQVDNYHRQMLSESIHLERLVSDLIDLARLQNPDLAMDMDQVDLKEIVADTVRSMRRVAAEKQVQVNFTYSRHVFTAWGDYSRLRQMVLILLDNAVKFSPVGGTVQVALSGSGSITTLSVTDEGPGIAPEDLPYIFERFYKQRSEANKTGTGLGLAIAKQIADKHGAVLEARNRPDTGSRFTVTIRHPGANTGGMT